MTRYPPDTGRQRGSLTRKEKTILYAVLPPFALVVIIGGMINNGPDRPRPTQSPTPIPTTSCYYAGSYYFSPSPGRYEPCDYVQSTEDEERLHIEDLQQRQKAEWYKQEEIDRAKYWEDVRRERLEREHSGQTPGGPVVMPTPGQLPPS